MAKRILFEDMTLDDVRQINNGLLQDIVGVAREADLGFAGAKGKDHVEGGWTRGGDHTKGGWTRGASIAISGDIVTSIEGLERK